MCNVMHGPVNRVLATYLHVGDYSLKMKDFNGDYTKIKSGGINAKFN